MGAPAILKIDIIADATKALKGIGLVEDKASGTGSKLSSLGKGVVGALGTAAIVSFGKDAVQAATEAGKSTARLDAVFASMGDTTGKASKAAQDYASALSKKIGVDDDAIMAAQAQLATFGAVSNETARTAGVFDRATAAAADLAAAGFGTLDSNSVQLGKALQDPTKGLAALAKSGVTFTKSQKDQITAMQQSGDLLGAQEVVLKAVEGQVKGTAAATATSQDKMQVAFGETQEAIGNALLPVIEKLLPILTTLADFVQRNVSWLLPLAAAIGVLAIAWNIASVAATLFGVSMATALWPVLAIIAGIAALIAIGVLVVRNWDTIKAAASRVWNFVLGLIQGVWNWIKANWPLLLAILLGPFGAAVAVIVRNWDTIKGAISGVWQWIKSTFSTLAAILTAPFTTAQHVIEGVWDSIWSKVQTVWGWIKGKFDALGGVASRAADALKGPINAVIRGWNAIEFKVPEMDPLGSFGPSIGGQTIGLPNIPLLAAGGSVLRTGLAIVHEGEQFSGVGRSFGGSPTTVNITVQTTGLGAKSPDIQRAVVDALRQYTARNGPLGSPIIGRAA
jgi:hypothetical protein